MANRTKFRSENNTRWTVQLFYEMYIDLPHDRRSIPRPLYTLNEDVDGYVNFRRAYVQDMDTTGYKTATRLLENYDHWNLLMKSKWFRDAKAQWDTEVAAKMEAEAIDKLRDILTDEHSKTTEQIAAAKALLGKAKTIGKKETIPQRGRPTKEEVAGALKNEMDLTREEEEDLSRIRLVSNANRP